MPRRSLLAPALLVTLAVVPAACGARDDAPARRAAHVLPLTFTRSGGFVGVDDVLRVSRDGRARVTHRGGGARTFHLRGGRLRALRSAIRAARLPRHRSWPSPPGTADAFEYRVAIPGHVVAAGEGGSAPLRVRHLLARLSGLVG
jgi:hypothetical protein